MSDARVVSERRRLPFGVEVLPDGGVHVRVWAPACTRLELVPADRSARWRLDREQSGIHTAFIPSLGAGDRYWLTLDGGPLRPDPCSRFQPEGPHGPSQVVDPAAFGWTDEDWPGVECEGQVLYEMHVGTFTPEGTWRSAMEHLPSLAALGITVVEMMPVTEFAGQFGWGYDGVDLYAPTHLYGEPDDLRAFVDLAHAVGLGVILDVVYNHLGPDGNYLEEFSPDYFTDKYENDWGRAVNFEGPAEAREFFVANAGYWIDEFHFDGLRLDATQDIHDASAEHVLRSIARRAREAAGSRPVYLVAENEAQHSRLARDASRGGDGLDALWNDDFHHSAIVALTGKREAYYLDYRGSAQELLSCVKYGFLYQGQYYSWQKKRRGTPALDLKPSSFVAYLENHDQVANTGFGRRLHELTSPGRFRALTALLLLGPATPLLFQGQEFNSSAPFLFFADHKPELQEAIRTGRQEFLSQFPSVADPEVMRRLPSPLERRQFERSRLDPLERETHREARDLHADLIALRRHDAAIRRATRIDGAVLAPAVLLLRYFGGSNGDRLLLLNLGADLELAPCPEPLLAPPDNAGWRLLWSSEDPKYGGRGTAPLDTHAEWRVPAECAVLLGSREDVDDDR